MSLPPVVPCPSSAALRHQLLIEWNDTCRHPAGEPDPAGRSISALVRAWAERTPDAPALEFADERLPYGELDRRAGCLARRLHGLGVGRETLVAVAMESSAARVVALLAILEAGGAYVPLEPTDPAERLAYLLADSGVTWVLTDAATRDRIEPLLQDRPSVRLLCPDGRDAEAGTDAGPMVPEPWPDQLANVIYTSGSTGRPKGVGVTHRGVVRLVRETNYIRFEPSDRVAQASNVAFDGSTFEIWGALVNGATLVGIPPLVAASPQLAAELRRLRVTVTVMPSPILHLLARTDPAAARSLRYLLFGAEPADPRWVREVLEKGRPDHLVNFYGPTETTVAAAAFRVTTVPADSTTVPIGRPIGNTTVYVVDRHGEPVAPGEVGELVAGGVGVARGYLDRPALTAERFVPNPFADDGTRLYRTGDRVRHRPDGVLEFLGRVDHQVKLHGVRIELGEIETRLARHPAISEAVVLLRQDRPGERRLVGYAVADGFAGDTISGRELRTWLATVLPPAMVPSSIVVLDRLPLLPNGKIDRRALPPPPAPAADYVAPRNTVERTVAEIAAELLGCDRVGVEDHLLELGGHSLMLAQMVNRIRETLAVEPDLADLFLEPTVAAVAARLQTAPAAGATVPPVRRAPRTGNLPASFAQERIWFLNQLAPGNLAYNVQLAIRLHGPLAPGLLARSFTAVVRRHEILRTTFPEKDGRPVQVIHPPWTVRIPVVDLERLDAADREQAAQRAIDVAVREPFDVARLPLLRLTLYRFERDEHLLLQMEHHFVHDGWSIAVLLGEIKAIYPALAAGRDAVLPELPVQYADFAVWQRQWMAGEVLERELAFWRQTLAGSAPPLELPADRPRPRRHLFRGDALIPWLPDDLHADLRRLGDRHGVSLFMTALAAFMTLLHRYGGQDDLVLGSGVANRRRRELEPMIGMVINTVAVRGDLSGRPSFVELLERTRRTLLDVQAHQDVPFEKLVAALRPDRQVDHNPLFQVIFAFHDSPVPELKFAGLTGVARYRHNRSAKADLTVIGAPGEGMHFVWEYSTDLFDRTTMVRMWQHYVTLLRGVVAEEGRRLDQLPLLTAGERQQLREWNPPPSRYPRESLAQLVAAWAERTPEATAVAAGEVLLSYRRLDQEANRLAHHLRDLGVSAETLVGVLMAPSAERVRAVLAVVKAGGAYVPLSPADPPARLRFLLGDCGARLLLVHEPTRELVAQAAEAAGFRIVDLTAARSAIAARPATPLPAPRAEQLAYVIYTSGSTGRPKGVQVIQPAVARLVLETDYVRLGPGDRVAQVANVAFDAATFEIWGPLLTGGCLVVIDQDVVLSPPALAAALAEQRITAMFLTVALFNQMVREAPAALVGVRHLLFGGEAADPHSVRSAAGRGDRGRLINGYGPTENTTFSTWYEVRELDPRAVTVPIGRPIASSTAVVVDRYGRPAPAGALGELHVGGDGLARGYLRRPGLTAERFVPDPFGPAGRRLYRTGDRVRARSDGVLEYVGRIDFQVKLRGFRIELGEIEAVLAEHPAVGQAVVQLRDEPPRGPRLVAWVVAADADPAPTQLADFLRQRLPEHMVPASFFLLDALPLLPTGKIDRRALAGRALPAAPDAGGDRFVAPQDPVEAQLAAIWGEVLGVGRIGRDDDFFALGGHSLLITQVASRIRVQLDVELPLRTLFEEPTLAAQAARIRESSARPAAPPMVPVPRDGELPLSYAEERLWFLDQLVPGNPFYNIPPAWWLRGPVDARALAQSLDRIVERHEVLRTCFPSRQGRPWRRIVPHRPLPMATADLHRLPAAAADAEARRLAAREALIPFDLAADRLMRATLLLIDDEQAGLLLTIHHIVADGWSMGVLLRELRMLYEALATGRPAALPEPRLQYADFAVWQRQWLSGEVLEEQLASWQRRLAGVSQLELLLDRPRPPVQTFRGGRVELPLPANLGPALHALGRDHGATLFMTAFAAFNILLYRLSGQTDLVVGTSVANRHYAELEGLIGFFVNTLALRTDLGGKPNFVRLLAQVRVTTLHAYSHQDVPFEKLVDYLGIERDLSRNPLFQVIFTVQNVQMAELRLPGIEVTRMPFELRTTRFDLELHLWDRDDELQLVACYDRDLHDATTVRRLAGSFAELLAAVAAAPDRRVDELPVLRASECHQLLVEWNDTAAAVGVYTSGRPKGTEIGHGSPVEWNLAPSTAARELTIPQLFAAQVEARPEAIAVVAAESALSYRELNARSNHLAHRLRALGVGPEVAVGLCLERSPQAIVAILAVLKAGGAYVPLDPSYPPERLGFMLQDAGAAVVVSRRGTGDSLPEEAGNVLWLDEQEPSAGGERAENLAAGVSAANLAYVLYTSGSTGRPKGVVVPHRGVVRLVREANYAAFSSEEVLLQHSSLSFDASTLELWASLLHGGRLAIPPAGLLSLEELGRTMARFRVTTLWLTAGLFHQMVEEQAESLRGVRQLLAGGDVLSVAHVGKMLAQSPGCRMINGYGPTENTTFTSCYQMDDGDRVGPTVAIGRPITGTRIYVLDRGMRPVAVGAPGELYAAGDGLARGYANRPGLTAECFVPSPLSRGPGERLYRTGDLARWLPDGNLEFLGRLDYQIKIRGFRIELGEIEAVLAECPAVQEAVVVAREISPGDKQLVAYVVGRGPGEPAAGELREALRHKLPDYMVPGVFVALERLPLNPNGKVDRSALPEPDPLRSELASSFVAPRTPEEEILAAIWAEVLGLDAVGVNDDFFELGGHSLLATRVITRLQESFAVELELRALFEAPTVAGLAARLREARARRLPPLEPRARPASEAPLSFAQERLWFLDRLAPGSAFYNISAAWLLRGRLDAGALERSFHEIVRRHELLRTRFPLRGAQPLQVVQEAYSPRLGVVDLMGLAAALRQAEGERLTAEEARRPIDLAAGPLLRLTLVRRDAGEAVLLLSMHHIISDGWSMGVFLRELGALYEAELAVPGGGSPLPDLAVQYADFALWQRRWLRGEALEQLLSYWRKKLEGAAVLELPTDRPRPAVQTFRGKRLRIRLPAALSGALHALSRERGTTLYMTLAAAFAVLLRRLSGQDEVVIGSPIANRRHAELEELIGFFVNTLALRGDLGGNPSFGEFLERMRETALEAYAHQDLPFMKLVEELHPEPDLSRNPIFQVLFALENASPPPLEMAGLKSVLLPMNNCTVRFDLELQLWERPEGLRGSFVYNRDLFDDSTIGRLSGNFRTLLEGIAAAAPRRLSDLPLLSAAQRQQLLTESNDTRTEYPVGQCFQDLFDSQARCTPDAVAAVFDNRRLSYRELDRRANQLARHLRKRGVGPEVLVGLCLPRSLDTLVGFLGILRAGGAYLPLDPEYPTERLAFMVEDARLTVLVSQRQLAEEVLAANASQLVCLAEDRQAIDRESTTAPASGVEPGNLAYAIYTSGSTGRPKAVLVPHRGLCSMSEAQVRTFGLGPGDRLLQFSSLNFDAATFEIVMALGAGSTLCLGTREELLPGPALIRLLRELQVTAMLLPPSALAGVPVEELPALRTVITAGEACPAGLVERWGRQRRFFNLYGPTEATIWTTGASCYPGGQPPSSGGGEKPPIGGPIANTQVFVLDRHLQPAPIGLPGELTIGGVGVTRGYLNRPELTAERFGPNPFSELPGTRLYRTGDLARHLPDGRLQFLGRTDHQVKIRGFRIELGEIEAMLGRHPAVRAAVAVVREDLPGDQRLVAYFVPDRRPAPAVERLRSFLRDWLPDHMVPAAFLPLEALPLTPNGKVDRRALPAPEELESRRETPFVAPETEIEQTVVAIWKEVLQTDQVGIHDNFFDLGGHSMHMAVVADKLQEVFDREVPLIELFQHPTISAMAELVAPEEPERFAPEMVESHPQARERGGTEIAVIGMAGRFPGAAGVEEFWRNLCAGVESISFFIEQDLESAGLDAAALADPRRVRAGGVLEDIDLFDASFFGINSREAKLMDPQQRVFLEEAWNALESAGYDPGTYPGMIGVYAGMCHSTYWLHNVYSHPEIVSSASGYQAFIANDKDFLPTRVSYKLNLRGPSVSVQTACSTSLVAIHQACQSLLNDECDMALAGGVAVRVPQRAGYLYQEGGILSPDGHCRAFDAQARGTIPGEGVGIVVLKRLADAVADGDSIRAVIKGSAVNNDGSWKVGYTAPSVDGQAEVIRRALARARVRPEEISLIEAHGTGTELGDPIEVAALSQVFETVPKKGFCALGSVKTNIGHVDAAAGAAGFIKTVLALEHELLPPSLHFERPNPRIDFEDSPFYVNARPSPWDSDGAPRRAGISSFGIGGTNAHVVVEQAPDPGTSAPSRPWQLLLVSARTPSALDAATANLGRHMRSHPEIGLAEAAYTLQVGRRAFDHRRFLLCQDRDEAIETLEAHDGGRIPSAVAERDDRPVAFMFPGQGAQHAGMGRELYDGEPVFREHVNACAVKLMPHLGIDLREVLYPSEDEAAGAGDRLDQTRLTQPALFVVEYALARLWMSWGVEPQAMIGHSIGEYVAACLAGVFSLENALALVAARGRLMQALPGGAMLAVVSPADEVRRHLGPRLSLAAINEPGRCVVSGPAEAVDGFERRLADEGIAGRRLRTSHAFHSEMMDPILEEFEAEVRRAAPRSPRIPFVSNLTGTWITAAQATDPLYWARHLRQTVELSRGIGELLQDPTRVLLEVGPGQGLSRAVRRRPARPSGLAVFPSLGRSRGPHADGASVLETLGRLWLAGVRVDWAGFSAHERRRRVPLPTYPFERKRYWIERAGAEKRHQAAPARRRSSEIPIASKMPEAPLGKTPEPQPGRRMPPSPLERIVDQQLQTMSRQLEITSKHLELLRGAHSRSAGRALAETRRLASRSPALTSAQLGVVTGAPGTAGGEVPEAEESVPLTPIQHWFFERNPTLPDHFNMARTFEVSLAPELVGKALQCLAEHHDALRLRFHRDASGWRQRRAREVRVTFVRIDLAKLAESDQAPAAAAAAATLRTSLNLSRGPLLRTALFAAGRQRPDRLLIAIHHLAVDVTSWRILLEDLDAACRQLEGGRPIQLAPRTTTFREWGRRLEAYSRSDELRRELGYWLAEPRRRVGRIPVDHPGGANTVASARTVSASLNRRETRLLQRVAAKVHGSMMSEVLLAALAQVLARWTGSRALVVEVEGHGREDLPEDVNLSRTVGWFTCLYPLLLELGDAVGANEAVRSIQRQIRRVPRGGIGYGLLRYLRGDEQIAGSLRSLPQAEVAFNYLGRHVAAPATNPEGGIRARLRPAREPVGPILSPQESRFHLIRIDALLSAGSLRLEWEYSRNLHRRSTIEDLAQELIDLLRSFLSDDRQSAG